MSILLPKVDLSSVVVGSAGKVQIQQADLTVSDQASNNLPVIQIYNDSGAGLQIQLPKSGHSFYLPAKGHAQVGIANNETEVDWLVQNVSTNIQVNQLFVVYFFPWEEVADFTPLGTSSVSQQATTLLNVGNPFGSQIFFAQPVGDTGVVGATVITNSGKITLGDGFVGNGHISIVGATSQDTQIDAGSLVMHNLSGVQSVLIQAAGTTVLPSQNVHLVGNTAGSIDLFQDFAGDIKRVVLVFNGFRNAGAAQTIAIPTPFTKGAQLMIGNINCTMSLLAGGVAQNINHYSNGAQTVATSVVAGNTAECASAFDTISLVTSGASPTTCIVTIIGF